VCWVLYEYNYKSKIKICKTHSVYVALCVGVSFVRQYIWLQVVCIEG